MCYNPYARVCEELEGGPNLFDGRDIVGVLHAYDDPPDVFRRFHSPISAFNGPDDCDEGLSGAGAALNRFVEEREPVGLEVPGMS